MVVKANNEHKPVKKESKHDIWSDSSYDNLDYDQLIAEEYHDLGYNPRELKPVGRELPQDDKKVVRTNLQF